MTSSLKFTAVAGAVVACCFGVAFYWLATTGHEKADHIEPTGVERPEGLPGAAGHGAHTVVSEVPAGLDSPAPTEASVEAVSRITGRCVTASGPIAGVKVSVVLRSSGGANTSDRGAALSGPDGRFEIQAVHAEPVPAPKWSVHLEGYVGRKGILNSMEPGTQLDLGDIVLDRGFELSGFVRDSRGEPIKSALVRATATTPFPHETVGVELADQAVCRSQADGSYAFPALRWTGWDVVATHRRFEDGTHAVNDPPTGAIVRHDFELEDGLTISGRVVHKDGTPVVDVLVYGYSPGSYDALALGVKTRVDGEFTLYSRGRGLFGAGHGVDREEAIEVAVADARYQGNRFEARWGDRVVVEAAPKPVVTLRVREGDSGLPLTEFGYRLRSGSMWGTLVPVASRDGTAQVSVEGSEVEHAIMVIPGPPYQAVGPFDIKVPRDGATVVDVEVALASEIAVVVVTDAGDAITGARVDLLASDDVEHVGNLGLAVDAHKPNFPLEGVVFRWDRGTTDGAGRVALAPPDLRGHTLWAVVDVPGRPTLVQRVWQREEPWIIEVAGGVHVSMRFDGAWPSLARVVFRSLSPSDLPLVPRGPGLVPASLPGGARVALAEGEWEAQLRVFGKTVTLETVEVVAGFDRELRWDAANWLWPSTECEVRVGTTAVTGTLEIRDLGAAHSPPLAFVSVVDGRARIPAMLIAPYEIALEGDELAATILVGEWPRGELTLR